MPRIVSLFAALLLSCGNEGLENSDLAELTFYNKTSYNVTIHEAFFEGVVLADKLSSGKSFSTKVRSSGNHGAGSGFYFKYWFMVASGLEVSGGDVWTGGLVDPNAHITQNIEAGKRYTIQIPQPEKWESSEAFVKIANKSDKHLEFNYLGLFYRQGNLEPAVPSGKVGIYKVNKLNPSDDSVEISGCTITQGFDKYPFPEFTAADGYIYSFEFDGNEVRKIGEQRI